MGWIFAKWYVLVLGLILIFINSFANKNVFIDLFVPELRLIRPCLVLKIKISLEMYCSHRLG